MLAFTARTALQIGKVSIRTIATKSKQNNGRFRVAATGAGIGLGTGTVTVALLGFGSSSPDWNQVRQDISDLLDDDKVVNPSVDEGVQGGGGFVAPMLLRLAWHCSGTWCKDAQNGGSDGGTMRFKPECDHGGNAGLGIARDLLEPIKAKHPNISYADLYILAGVVAVEEMGGPKVTFNYGRTDAKGPTDPKDDARFSPDGRLPDGDKDAQHIRDIFYRMGFDDRGIVALSGAHAVGRCHTDRSGFWGPWTYAESTLSNEYSDSCLKKNGLQRQHTKGKNGLGHLNLKILKGT